MKEIIQKYNIKAKKSLGQNFLVDENILLDISNITSIEKENIIEIGPGFGVLTQKILNKNPLSLTLVELDNSMIKILEDRIKNKELNIINTNFCIVNQDILKYTPLLNDYKIIANIPYYITSPILFKFLYEVNFSPKNMIILMQKEVGEKILSNKSSVLSLFIKRKCEVKKEIIVSKNAFLPSPKIDSIVLYFSLKENIVNIDEKEFLKFIKTSFSNPRKKVINNLIGGGYDKNIILTLFKELGYDQNTRAEDICVEDYEYIIQKIFK